jgi:predicted transposase/invertase (TIGR01784 family)
LKKGISIIFLNFDFLPQPDYHSLYGIYNLNTGHRLTDDFEMHFLEIKKWPIKSLKEMKRLDRWLGCLSNRLNEKEMEELAMAEPAIEEALRVVETFMSDPQKRREYELREKAIRDHYSSLSSAREEGIEEGWEKGKLEGKLEDAQAMLKKGISLETVAEITELSVEKLMKLLNQ